MNQSQASDHSQQLPTQPQLELIPEIIPLVDPDVQVLNEQFVSGTTEPMKSAINIYNNTLDNLNTHKQELMDGEVDRICNGNSNSNLAQTNPIANVNQLDRHERQALSVALTPKLTKFAPHYPTPKQAAFLLLDNKEAFFGGAAGGGKSDALLMAALQYVDVPGYSAILFRRTYSDLTLPGALMDRAADWLAPYIQSKEARWIDKLKTYVFNCPGGGTSTLTFGYLEHDNDKYRYQGAEFQFIGFDEVTQLLESCYRYLFSRLRRLKGVKIPLRVRGASNPGGAGHEWVKRRFITEAESKNRIFIPAKMDDNPFLDVAEYESALEELDPITRAQLRNGNWEVKTAGSMFHREWFELIPSSMVPWQAKKVRFWDLASTEKSKLNRDPDWTVGVLLALWKGIYYVVDIRRVRRRPKDVEELIKHTAVVDGYSTAIRMEQEPGSSGVSMIDHYASTVLVGYDFRGVRSTGSKVIRANPVSSAAEGRRIKVVQAPWNGDFFDELESFPEGEHDDQVDSLSGGLAEFRLVANMDAGPIEVGEVESYWEGVG